MAKKKPVITNAMRMLTSKKIPFKAYEYEADEVGDNFGCKIAELLGINPAQSYKTLVGKGDKTGILVAVIPVENELDLKKLASESGNKSVQLVPVKDLLGLTGYIRGGCSPVGMKKRFPTYFHSTAVDFEHIYVSAGVRGLQIQINPADLISFVGATVADVACNNDWNMRPSDSL
jgi:Cys-tRNA(Pro)/Cys-tRNA(Cys) deacylase